MGYFSPKRTPFLGHSSQACVRFWPKGYIFRCFLSNFNTFYHVFTTFFHFFHIFRPFYAFSGFWPAPPTKFFGNIFTFLIFCEKSAQKGPFWAQKPVFLPKLWPKKTNLRKSFVRAFSQNYFDFYVFLSIYIKIHDLYVCSSWACFCVEFPRKTRILRVKKAIYTPKRASFGSFWGYFSLF